MENRVIKVQQNLKEAQDRHKSYMDLKIRHQEFQVGDHVYLNVKERRHSLTLGNYSKLVPRFSAMEAGVTKRRVLSGTSVHSIQKRNNTTEQSRHPGKSAMEAL
jgi:hypothetical protein